MAGEGHGGGEALTTGVALGVPLVDAFGEAEAETAGEGATETVAVGLAQTPGPNSV